MSSPSLAATSTGRVTEGLCLFEPGGRGGSTSAETAFPSKPEKGGGGVGNLGQPFSLPGRTSLTTCFLKILIHSSGERWLPADLLSQPLVREEMRARCGQRRGEWRSGDAQ